jgi:hypothetical protein
VGLQDPGRSPRHPSPMVKFRLLSLNLMICNFFNIVDWDLIWRKRKEGSNPWWNWTSSVKGWMDPKKVEIKNTKKCFVLFCFVLFCFV